jgi:multidrug resistance efflux pump
LSERDVPKVAVGQTATVTVKALNQDITGRVSAISPLADTLGGDQVYKVTIDLDKLPPGLLAGMSVVVQIDTSSP